MSYVFIRLIKYLNILSDGQNNSYLNEVIKKRIKNVLLFISLVHCIRIIFEILITVLKMIP